MNAYCDLEKVLKHYGGTFDDVIFENVYTTNRAESPRGDFEGFGFARVFDPLGGAS